MSNVGSDCDCLTGVQASKRERLDFMTSTAQPGAELGHVLARRVGELAVTDQRDPGHLPTLPPHRSYSG